MINRKIAMSGMSIIASLALMGGATFAFFSDSAASTGNTFAAGTIDLQLDDNNEDVSQSVTGSITGAGMVPGGLASTGFISYHNPETSTNIAEVEFKTDVAETADPGDDSFLGNVIDMTVLTGDDQTCTTNQSNLTGTLATVFGDGFSPLTLSEMNGNTYDALPGLTPGTTKYVCLTAQMESGAGNVYQGDGVTVDFTFTGNQDASQ